MLIQLPVLISEPFLIQRIDSNSEIQCVMSEIDNCCIRKTLNFEISLFEKERHSPFMTRAQL